MSFVHVWSPASATPLQPHDISNQPASLLAACATAQSVKIVSALIAVQLKSRKSRLDTEDNSDTYILDFLSSTSRNCCEEALARLYHKRTQVRLVPSHQSQRTPAHRPRQRRRYLHHHIRERPMSPLSRRRIRQGPQALLSLRNNRVLDRPLLALLALLANSRIRAHDGPILPLQPLRPGRTCALQ